MPSLGRPPQPGVSSPTRGRNILSTLKVSMSLLQKSCRVFPALESAVGTLLEVLEPIEISCETGQELLEMASELPQWAMIFSSYLSDSQPEHMSKWVERLIKDLAEHAGYIRAQQQLGKMERMIGTDQGMEELRKCYHRIETSFNQLQTDAGLRTWANTDNLLKNSRLEALKSSRNARFNSKFSSEIERGGCLQNTRISILDDIRDWIRSPGCVKIYWANGMAGTGKTTIAYSVCAELKERKKLGASFFCSRISPECRDVSRILPTLAHQLAQQVYPFRSSLCRVLDEEPDIGQYDISAQFECLIRSPLLEVQDLLPTDLVIVIDALDECSDPNAVGMMLNALFRHAADLPILFFLTSRPEPPVVNAILAHGSSSHSVLYLHNVEECLVKADIEVYLSAKLGKLSLGGDQLNQLAERAGILFIYAATVVKYLTTMGRGVNISARLASMLAKTKNKNNKVNQKIDQLYRAILDAVLDEDQLEQDEIDLVKHAVWTVVCAREPITKGTLAVFLKVTSEYLEEILQPLQSVLRVSEGNQVVSTLHASFPEFILESERSGLALYCNEGVYNEHLAERCFQIMEEQLKFNICGIESSFQFDRDLPDLVRRTEKAISPELFYACRYWSEHMRQSLSADRLLKCLDRLLHLRLLFWMEVLNLKGRIGNGIKMLTDVQAWLSNMGNASASGTLGFLHDARNFVTSFAASPICQSTPHIYVSALPLVPKRSKVWQSYWGRTRGLLRAEGTLINERGDAPLVTWEVGCEVTTVAYSSDGANIAFGSKTGAIQVWDAFRGIPYGKPLQGHTSTVSSVAFSPDGFRIVSGSWDRTLRIWDAQNGTQLGSPLIGHTKAVWSVAVSPDGSRVVSGSTDCTVRVWNIKDGASVGAPFRGHVGTVKSVAFSPDGVSVASGSEDRTIGVWDIESGSLLGKSPKVHTNAISSISFSPDGSRVVSGSRDCTVRIWDARCRALLGNPFEGHTDVVTSVAFSPDGKRIVSSSADCNIRVWDAGDGRLLGKPIRGHSKKVLSVAFSPDGSCIVSGSEDSSIRVWDARRNDLLGDSFEGHTKVVTSVDFSADNAYIISKSLNEAIRVWDAKSGLPVGGPLLNQALSSVAKELQQPKLPEGVTVHCDPRDFKIFVQCQTDSDGTHEYGGGNLTFKGHTDRITNYALSEDRRRFISSSHDCTIRVWKVSWGDGHHEDSKFEGLKSTKEGWLVDPVTSALMFWVPAEMRATFPLTPCLLIISPKGCISTDSDNLLLGKCWAQCYSPSEP